MHGQPSRSYSVFGFCSIYQKIIFVLLTKLSLDPRHPIWENFLLIKFGNRWMILFANKGLVFNGVSIPFFHDHKLVNVRQNGRNKFPEPRSVISLEIWTQFGYQTQNGTLREYRMHAR